MCVSGVADKDKQRKNNKKMTECSNLPEAGRENRRIATIDVFRALTMFLMLFVNDIPGLRDIPHWLRHAEYSEDMLGFSDTIFPAFLFCVWLSVPFAIKRRYEKGDSTTDVIKHIVGRTVALVAMGLFTLNARDIEGGLSYQWFNILMVVGFFLVWGVYPKAAGAGKYVFAAMKVAGVLLLAFLVVYCDVHGRPFERGWWGILGLIGFTYAVCATVYLFTRENFCANAVVWVAVVLLAVGNHSWLIPYEYGSRVIFLPFMASDWTLHAFGMSGVFAAMLLRKYAFAGQCRRFIIILCVLGAVMLALALVAHGYWIISKIQATPTWLFFCLAVFFPLFGLFYWLVDIKGKGCWFNIIKPAGTATLTCYMLPYLWYSVQQLLGLYFPDRFYAGAPGLLKSAVFSLVIVLLAGLMSKVRIKLKI